MRIDCTKCDGTGHGDDGPCETCKGVGFYFDGRCSRCGEPRDFPKEAACRACARRIADEVGVHAAASDSRNHYAGRHW
jgi:RecJ-like exonuclease